MRTFQFFSKLDKMSFQNGSALVSSIVKLFHMCFPVNVGCGILFLFKVWYQLITKTSSYGKLKVLFIVPAGVAAINIDGNNLHAAVGYFGKNITFK